MEPSILVTIKKILGLDQGHTAFDLDLVTHINATFAVLFQMGIGPEGMFTIEDDSATWADYNVPADQLALSKSYLGLKVRLLFDPPATSFAIAALEKQIEEFEWRVNVMREGTL